MVNKFLKSVITPEISDEIVIVFLARSESTTAYSLGGSYSTDIRKIPDCWGIFHPIEARYNEFRLATDCAGSQIAMLVALKGRNASLGLYQSTPRPSFAAMFAS